jgi:hypothetical protein
MTPEINEGEPRPEHDLLDLIDGLDVARNRFFEASKLYTHMPTSANFDVMGAHILDVSDAFMQTASFIVDNPEIDDQEKSDLLAVILKEDDIKRVFHFSNLVPEKVKGIFKEEVTTRKDLAASIARNLEDAEPDEFKAHMAGHFQHNFELDLNKLMEAVESMPSAKLLTLSKAIGKHALDIAKITAGVTLGIAFSRMRRR